MAANTPCGLVSLNHVGVVPKNEKEMEQNQTQMTKDNNTNIDYTQRAQWLRAAVLGANDGLVSVASLMMGVGAVKRDVKAMLLAGFAGSIAGACGMAIGEFVSVYTQYEVEVSQMKRDMDMSGYKECEKVEFEMRMEKRRTLPNPMHAALASALSFTMGALVPLLSAAFISDYKIRLLVVVAMASLALVIIGILGAELGKTPKLWSCVRVLVGGWMAMAVTFGLTKSIGSSGLEL
ncbi:hypothetical protein TanjilG_23755 [Lupinus angustifolius]|uniref:Vacuolar iron transporter n=1 Tax=Lupinus angustifolius TaxID=3871 RepID=A0A1J7I133_LUPAN|nr:PREDICTED: vacuolar iron transporter homolog 4-like [Lupinus angustifolius]OIW18978.1 hypothetical protein TanjilG_23755 [Lupinus angustifolius]